MFNVADWRWQRLLAGFWLSVMNLNQAVQAGAPSTRTLLLSLFDALRAFPFAGQLSAEEGSG
jgi:hypothetical protein